MPIDNSSRKSRRKAKKQPSTENVELFSLKSCRSELPYDKALIDEIQARMAYTLLMKLLQSGRGDDYNLQSSVQPDEIETILDCVKLVFMSQASCLEIDGQINVCGDIHGQYSDLLRIFDKSGFPHRANYLFLGDYVDRGRHSLETILTLFCYKLIYPNHMFLLRGNHECPAINKVYGFYDECAQRYGKGGIRMWEAFQDTFSCMPITAIIGEKILCMHGGVSPRLRSLDQLRQFRRPNYQPDHESIEIDILWSDPASTHKGWCHNQRGVSFTFGADVLKKMLNNLGIDLVVRAHQVVQDGYEFFAQRHLVTIFSAPFYCGQFDNAAAVLTVTEDLILRPKKYFPKRKIQSKEKPDKSTKTVIAGV